MIIFDIYVKSVTMIVGDTKMEVKSQVKRSGRPYKVILSFTALSRAVSKMPFSDGRRIIISFFQPVGNKGSLGLTTPDLSDVRQGYRPIKKPYRVGVQIEAGV